MRTTALAAAVTAIFAAGAIAPQGAPADGAARPHIKPVMTLRPAAAAGEYELIIYGDIGESWWGDSVTAQSVVQQLIDLDDSVTTINVRINSYGGSVADGLAIYNALKRHSAKKVVTVDGVAMSSASLIAMCGDTIQMPATSLLMIHAPWGGMYGNAMELRQYANVLDTYAEAMADAYVSKSGKARADVTALLTDGVDHYYTGEQAVAEGFADELVSATQQEPDEQARTFAKGLLHRYASSLNRAPEGMAELAIAAALRARSPATATGAESPPAHPAPRNEESDMRIQGNAAGTSNQNPAPGGAAPAAGTAAPASSAADRNAILAEDSARRAAIATAFAPFVARDAALATLQRQCEDDTNCTADAAGQRLLTALGTQAQPLNGQPRVEAGTQDTQQTYREGAAQAILNRAFPGIYALDERSQEFRGFTLCDFARDCVERAGTRTRGLSRAEIAVRAIHSTSDLPAILEQVITRTLRQGYDATVRTFVPFARRATLPDFREVARVQLGGAPALKKVLEGAEYEEGTIGDGAEKYRATKYGRKVAVTWEVIINDDFDTITRMPSMFGNSAAELENDVVWAIFTGNPNMADGVPLFHADHGNLGTAGAISETTLGEMQEKMLLQTGIDGRHITVRPEFLLVPPKHLVTAQKQLVLPINPAKVADANPFHGALKIIAEPRLQDAGATAWFAAANPNAIDTIEYAYLEGHEGVYTETRHGFDIDGVEVKCRHVFAAKAIDWRGLFKNPQAA
jgi:ATP-dependent protease ClpP protease subunit